MLYYFTNNFLKGVRPSSSLSFIFLQNKLKCELQLGRTLFKKIIYNARMSELEQTSNVMQQYIEGRKWREVAMEFGRGAASEELS